MHEAKKAGMPTWAVVLIVVGVASVFVMGTLAAFAIYGVRKYMRNAKRAEGIAMMDIWRTGMIECGQKTGALPASSAPVPASLASVSGVKYQSSPGEWAAPAFACAGFALSDPQYFQYQWSQESESQGVLQARADLDADGSAEESFEARITCAGGRCTTSALTGAPGFGPR